MDLELILQYPEPETFTNKGIPKGIALRIIREIPKWAAGTKLTLGRLLTNKRLSG